MSRGEVHSVLTEPEMIRLMSRGLALQCVFCEGLLQIDDEFVRKRTSGNFKHSGVMRYYHERCWKKTFQGD